tara:strand:+ start:899 stop:1783 length:885 start_codon:yes stop_codon:yes gene_type:complete
MPNKDYYIIYNPISGNGASSMIISRLIEDLKNNLYSFEIIKTEFPGHATQVCKQIKGPAKIIAVGGDGTFNEVINGAMQNSDRLILGFMPGGTGNAFMHDLNATTYEKAFSLIIQNKTKKIDIMKLVCNNIMEYSFNIVGWGMASDINSLAEKLRSFGPARYTLASIYHVFHKKSRRAKVIIDNQKLSDDFLFILCLNTIHTGKGMKAAPNAILNDGFIDVIILKSSISKLELLLLLPKIFSGKHILSKKVKYVKAKNLSIIPEKDEKLNIDGEMKQQTPISIEVLPKQINVLM